MPRWDKDAKKILQNCFQKLYDEDPDHCRRTLHPLIGDKEWKNNTFQQFFAPKGFTKEQWYRNYNTSVETFQTELEMNGARLEEHMQEGRESRKKDYLQSFQPKSDENNEASKETSKINKREKQLEPHPFIIMMPKEKTEHHIPITFFSKQGENNVPSEARYFLELPRGIDFDMVEVEYGSGLLEFIIEIEHTKNWFVPDILMSEERLCENYYVWQCALRDSFQDNRHCKVRLNIKIPFRIETIDQKGTKVYKDKKKMKSLKKEIEYMKERISELESTLNDGEELTYLQKMLESKIFEFDDPMEYFWIMEVKVKNLDYNK